MADWYYAKAGMRLGPIDAQELKRLATAGSISPEDLVWQEGMTDWAPARRLKGLFPVVAQEPPPLPRLTPPVATVKPLPLPEVDTTMPAVARPWYGTFRTSYGDIFAALVVVTGVGLGAREHFKEPKPDNPAAAISKVLLEEKATVLGSKSLTEAVDRVSRIDLSRCPGEFGEAYIAYRHAWEAMAAVEREFQQHEMTRSSKTTQGNSLSKIHEEVAASARLIVQAEHYETQIQSTRNHVHEIAERYGATIPPIDR